MNQVLKLFLLHIFNGKLTSFPFQQFSVAFYLKNFPYLKEHVLKQLNLPNG